MSIISLQKPSIYIILESARAEESKTGVSRCFLITCHQVLIAKAFQTIYLYQSSYNHAVAHLTYLIFLFPQGHPRFKTLTRNIRERRGEKVKFISLYTISFIVCIEPASLIQVAINVPVYPDVKTPKGMLEDLSSLGDDDGSSAAAAKPGHIYMDAMGFGMGLSCLQVTFQASSHLLILETTFTTYVVVTLLVT